jgi:hypothetical protein
MSALGSFADVGASARDVRRADVHRNDFRSDEAKSGCYVRRRAFVAGFFSSHDFPVGGLVRPRKQPVPPVAHGPDSRLRLRRRHHLLKQLSGEPDRVDLVVVAAGREAQELGAEVGEP